MQKQLALLWELQCLEQQQAALRRQCAAVHDTFARAAAQETAVLERSIADGRQQLKTCQGQCTRMEKLYREEVARSRELEERLYSMAGKSKELAPLQERCNTAKAAVTAREETLLELLAQLETLEAEVKNQNAQLTVKQNDITVKRKLAERDEEMKRQELAKLAAQSDALISHIDSSLLQWYRRMSQSLPQPVARVRSGTCSGCCVALPQRQLAGPHREIAYCENCGRALMFSD